jgi:hypothetical protein
MPSMRAALLFWGLLHADHAYLELALAKLTWSLCWPCSSGACAGHALLELVLAVFLSFTVLLGLFPSLY